jgi:hypothetical protein
MFDKDEKETGECTHYNSITEDIPSTDERIVICLDCGYEL